MIRVIIADDHSIFAESLQLMLQQDNDIAVEGIALNGKDAVTLCMDLLPDLVLLDIKMPGYNGIEAAKIIKNTFPDIKIAILTTFEDFENITQAFINGINGYILKDITSKELVLAVKCIICGFQVMHGPAGEFLQREFIRLSNNMGYQQQQLKDEDIKIIKLISDGKSNREIGELMNYTEGTIKNRVSRLIELFEVKDRTQVVVHALKNNLI
ncbi:MAG TPA: response regulator transcription factor [Bacillota bacterium]|nr:response regulator transcription factor [Bacillota bacterium]HPA53706.1 response regulator transcription factor [Bacillota bacterium]HPX69567.1 response regulator transcription factor [Bacillota bacterium]HQA65254.1 response regulator transcription factor [Bacillota bacterium]HQO41950.1 response regulator transcription factor [Bacillota bacterium]